MDSGFFIASRIRFVQDRRCGYEREYAWGFVYGMIRRDFEIEKRVTFQEASETGDWLDLAYRTNAIDEVQLAA